MFWKIVVVLGVALCVQGEEDAISEQRVVIHQQKSFRGGSLSHIGPNKSGNQDAYARSYPSYEFSYNVNDPKTRDIKGQHEIREGDEVIGNYWLIEPNGRKRTVKYQANDDIGFNAQVDYTPSLQGEDRDKDGSLSQSKGIEQGNLAKSDEKVIEISIGEEIQDIQNSNDASGDNGSQPTVEENSLSSESDNQEDSANNISNVERVDSNYNGNLAQSSQNLDNNNQDNNKRNLNKSPRRNRANNDAKKRKLEKQQKSKNESRVFSRNSNESNKNNHEGSRNSKRIRQDNIKQNDNRNFKKGIKSNSDKNLNMSQNSNSNDSIDTVNKEHIDVTNQEENESKQQEIKKGDNNNNEQKNIRNNDNYSFINLTPSTEIQRKIDIPNSEQTYEHRIRIYHPKNISLTPKEKHRKH